MVVDSRARISMFVYGVSDVIVNEFKIAMFIKEINLSKLMFYAQQIEQEKLKEKKKENKKARTDRCNFSQQRSNGGNHS